MMNLFVLSLVGLSGLLARDSTAQVYDPSLNHFRPHGDAGVLRAWWKTGSNSSLPPTNSSALLIKGFTTLGLSVIGFGSALVPIKHTETGDGVFFQWVFCSTLGLWSLAVHVIQGCPTIWPLTLLGGFLFAIANLTTIPMIKTIGLGIGFLILSTTSLLMAWATARFGWFGLDQQNVSSPTMNYIGTGLAAVSTLILFCINTEEKRDHVQVEETKSLLCNSVSYNQPERLDSLTHDNTPPLLTPGSGWAQRLGPVSRKIIGCSLATFAGLVYGCSYTPIIYIKNSSLKNGTHFQGASQYDLDYIFPYMTGINVSTSIVFFVYCMVTKNSPYLPKCVLPAFISASVQFLSQVAFFIACYCLGTIITYPICSAGPALVSLIWSVFYFREIKGTKNFLILAAVLVTVLSGVVLITLSKIE